MSNIKKLLNIDWRTCPICKGNLTIERAVATCSLCNARYEVRGDNIHQTHPSKI